MTAPSALAALVLTVLAVGGAQAQTVAEGTITLNGNHPNEAAALSPLAHADFAMPLQMHAKLGLRNRAQLDQLIQDQQDPNSPRYHQWLTPVQFTAQFGPSQQDLDAVVQWLGAQGLNVTASSLALRSVRFTGTVADAERVFHTKIMLFGSGAAYANITDPMIPARFSGIISAVGGLDNFLHEAPASQHLLASQPAASGVSGWVDGPLALLDSGPVLPLETRSAVSQAPDFTFGGSTAFGASDLHSFYDENTLLGSGINGSGSGCIGIVGESDFLASAVSLYNTTFGLAASSITEVLVDGSNPGINSAETETLLDLELSHAMAPGAATRYYLGNSSASTNGPIVDAIQRAVTDNLCPAISVSFSLCGVPASFFTGTVSPIYAQAASQGQSIFISSGDQGAAGITLSLSPFPHCATATTRNVNELASDPNVTEVGGTGFTPVFDGSGNNVGHVTELAWNDPGNGATGGGVSTIYSRPAYQTGPGVPAGSMRVVPDVALMASAIHPGAFLGNDNLGSPVIACCIGGTSLSSPAWAGISMLIAQMKHSRPGPLNSRIYALADAGQAASGFRDVTSGNNDFNGVTGFSAGSGFDLTTGWGTVDLGTFVNVEVNPPSPAISSVPAIIRVGSSFTITGSFFSPHALVNFFVATAGPAINAGPLVPSFISSTSMTVPVPATVPLGQGFVTLQLVNADLNFKPSNFATALLQGNAAAGIPTLLSINGKSLAATSSNPSFATDNVETVIVQGTTVTLGGTGFDSTHGVAINVFSSAGKAGLFISPGASLTSTSVSFTLPLSVATGPGSIVVVNKGADGSFSKSSNAVSVPVGAAIMVSSVSQPLSTSPITVNGAGFSPRTVINFFNVQGAVVVNLGGFGASGAKIPLTLVNSNQFTFAKPLGAVAGPSYVQAINPPFVPFTSSGNDPGGAFTLK